MKRFWISYISTLILACILLLILIWIFGPGIKIRNQKIVSPLPDFLSMTMNDQVSTVDLFLPAIRTVEVSNVKDPNIQAKSVLVYNLITGLVTFSKNSQERLPMASLTKIMTAIVALENKKNDDKYYVYKKDLVGEDSMGLSENETLSLEDLIYGLLLPSGNDAAEVLADNYPAGREDFIKAMNKKAKSLGLSNTHFTNPSGLQGDGNQYTTAYDLLVMTNYALTNFPLFKQAAATVEHIIPKTDTHKAFYLENETNLLTSYPGVKGVKTGYTPEADLCLVTYLEYDGQKIIGIILGSNNRREEMKELLDYSLKLEGITPPPHQ